jgi:hypothetical protein
VALAPEGLDAVPPEPATPPPVAEPLATLPPEVVPLSEGAGPAPEAEVPDPGVAAPGAAAPPPLAVPPDTLPVEAVPAVLPTEPVEPVEPAVDALPVEPVVAAPPVAAVDPVDPVEPVVAAVLPVVPGAAVAGVALLDVLEVTPLGVALGPPIVEVPCEAQPAIRTAAATGARKKVNLLVMANPFSQEMPPSSTAVARAVSDRRAPSGSAWPSRGVRLSRARSSARTHGPRTRGT